jgi:hypothetical protein
MTVQKTVPETIPSRPAIKPLETRPTARGKEEEADKLLSFPHLVFKEFICLMFISLLLVIVSMALDAPLEEIATASKTPNPAKAPWYFVGLQEMLVYFDPWIAGVIVPAMIIIGLMAIPFVDRNPRGVGRYCVRERWFAFTMFTIGIVAWFGLIIFGYFFRGPSWLFYWPWESWEIHKAEISAGTVVLPTHVGVAALLVFYGLGMGLPIIFANRFYRLLGPTRYFITMLFVLTMFGFLGKIPLRFIFDIKYILQTPWFSI